MFQVSRYFRSWALSTDINQFRLDRFAWHITQH